MKEFETFSLFLNHLKEFTAAIRLYAGADIPVSQAEFIRAVKATTGYTLAQSVVKILYDMFDANNDEHLSYSEFIAIMNDRLHRGLKVLLSVFKKVPEIFQKFLLTFFPFD